MNHSLQDKTGPTYECMALNQQNQAESTYSCGALKQQLEKERLIHQISLRIRETFDWEECLQTTVKEVRDFLQTDRVLIYRFNEDWSGYIAVESVGEGWVSIYQQTLRDPCFGKSYAELFRRGQIRIIPDIRTANYAECHIQFLEQFQVRANLVVPIIQGQRLWGLLIAHHCQGARQWQELEVDLLQQLAIQVAIAVHQAELYTQMQAELTERRRITEELKRTRDEALIATQAKSNFLATMSHEIRTPMNGVIGMTELLLGTNLSDEQRRYVTTINSCGQLLLTIINDILDFSKVESGKLELEAAPFDLRASLEEIVALFSPQVTEKNLNITYHLAPGVPYQLIGDATRIRQILVNLIGNAVKFTNTGRITIEIAAHPVSSEGKPSTHQLDQQYELQCLVADTGIGIPPEKLNRLFSSFYQVDSSTARQYGGTGLGLSICKRLCELMGGRIWVESTVGSGSKFHFTITVTGPSTPQVQLDGKRLLMVSQDPSQQQILEAARTWGMTVYTARSSYEAIGILACEDLFDLILLPQNLSQMTGLQLAQSIRNRPNYGQVPIIMLQSEPTPDSTVTTTNLVTHWMAPPLQLDHLRSTLLSSLQHLSCLLPLESSSSEPLPLPVDPDSPLKILLAEDNMVNQQLVIQLLSKLGYSADIVSNGFQVLEALQKKPYDLILMDVQMPGMDGLHATERICQQWPSTKRPKIVAITANAMEGDRELCLSKGMDDYMIKPINFQRLAEVLQHYASQKAENGNPSVA